MAALAALVVLSISRVNQARTYFKQRKKKMCFFFQIILQNLKLYYIMKYNIAITITLII